MNRHLLTILLSTILCASCSLQAQTVWQKHNPQEIGKTVIRGTLFPEELSDTYRRFPERLKSEVRKEVFHLSTMSAGLSIRFRTNASQIRIDYTTLYGRSMHHMPFTGVSGVDLYTRHANGTWLWCAPRYTVKDTIEYLYPDINYPMNETNGREYDLLLPLYNQVGSLSVNVPEGSFFEFLPISKELPIIVYGTSIAQGACASRPGMAWSNIVGRTLDIPIVNLGFSGNAFLEPEIIDLTIARPSRLIILDNLPNLVEKNSEKTYQLAIDAVQQIRRKSDTPILLVDHTGYPYGAVSNDRKSQYTKVNEAQYKAFEYLKAQKIKNLYYLTQKEMNLSNDAYVDGVHPTDLGMQQQADAYIRIIRHILKKTN